MRPVLVAGLVLAASLLTACGREPEEAKANREEFAKRLPPGCQFHDLGNYAGRSTGYATYPIFVVTCPSSTTTTIRMPSGKSSTYYSITALNTESAHVPSH